MAKKSKATAATPSHRAVGRVVRAMTYPGVSAELDLTLRELEALATLSHVNLDCQVSTQGEIVDSFDALYRTPGAYQSFWKEEQFIAATDRLAALGLVELEATNGERLSLKMESFLKSADPNMSTSGPGRIARLTPAGLELVDAMAGNLRKSLTLLDTEDVREDLELYEPA